MNQTVSVRAFGFAVVAAIAVSFVSFKYLDHREKMEEIALQHTQAITDRAYFELKKKESETSWFDGWFGSPKEPTAYEPGSRRNHKT